MARGGYQRPSRPAPVSGPGALSKRTDGAPGQGIKSLPNAGYGENKDFRNIQQGAAMAQSEAQPAPQMPPVTPLGAMTQRPNEPITTGIPLGPGAGPEALGKQNAMQQRLADMQALADYLPLFEQYANTSDASNTMKSFVKYLRSQT